MDFLSHRFSELKRFNNHSSLPGRRMGRPIDIHHGLRFPLFDMMGLDLLFVVSIGSRNIEYRLELFDEEPLIGGDLRSVEFFQGINTLPRDQGVNLILLLDMSAVQWLIGAFDLDRRGWLTFLEDSYIFVIALEG